MPAVVGGVQHLLRERDPERMGRKMSILTATQDHREVGCAWKREKGHYPAHH